MNDHNELRAIGERLLRIAEGGALGSNAAEDAHSEHSVDDRYLVSVAQAIYASRRQRDRVLLGDLFGEPAWDMLLDLFIRGARGLRTAVTSLCVASGVPPTTALRWVGTLQEAGVIIREESEHDRRVAYLKLSGEGYAAIRRCLIEVARYLRPAENFFLLHEPNDK